AERSRMVASLGQIPALDKDLQIGRMSDHVVRPKLEKPAYRLQRLVISPLTAKQTAREAKVLDRVRIDGQDLAENDGRAVEHFGVDQMRDRIAAKVRSSIRQRKHLIRQRIDTARRPANPDQGDRIKQPD